VTRYVIAAASLMILSAAKARAQDDAVLRGKTAMSAYVSVYGSSEIYAVGIRLALEQALHDMGITVLPHGSPPNFPVLNLTMRMEVDDERVVTATNKIELRQLAPGQTREMRPIKDVAIWTLEDKPRRLSQIDTWIVPQDALELAKQFAARWAKANPGRRAPTPDAPMPVANPNATPPPSDEPGQSLHRPADGCRGATAAGGGCIQPLSQAVTLPVNALGASQMPAAVKEIERLKNEGAMVITCEYGPTNPQSNTGFATFHFWYQKVPADILKVLISAFPHPLMDLGRVAVPSCPATRALASVIHASRFN
jgi:hypothetical protein